VDADRSRLFAVDQIAELGKDPGFVGEETLFPAAYEAVETSRQDEMVSIQVKPIARRAKSDE